MILKFQESDSWVIFGEIDHLTYREIEGNIPKDPDGNCLSFDPALGAFKDARHMQVEFFTKNMTEATVMNAYSPIYLMNDRGQTVEII
jgi:hypothetical protein